MTDVVTRQRPTDRVPDRYARSYTQLSARVKELGLLRRRYGYY